MYFFDFSLALVLAASITYLLGNVFKRKSFFQKFYSTKRGKLVCNIIEFGLFGLLLMIALLTMSKLDLFIDEIINKVVDFLFK